MDFDFTHSDGIFSLLGVPFLLSLVILFWKLRSALSASVNTIEIYGGFILAITGFLATASFIIFIMIADSLNSFEIWVISTVSLLIMASIIFSFVNIRKNVPHLSKVHLALLSAYIPNAVLCLGLFFKDWQLGAKFAAFAVILYLTEIVVITINEWRSNKQYAQSGSYDVFSSLRVDRM